MAGLIVIVCFSLYVQSVFYSMRFSQDAYFLWLNGL